MELNYKHRPRRFKDGIKYKVPADLYIYEVRNRYIDAGLLMPALEITTGDGSVLIKFKMPWKLDERHPESETLVELRAGRLSKIEKRKVRSHLAVCDICAKYTMYMVDDPVRRPVPKIDPVRLSTALKRKK